MFLNVDMHALVLDGVYVEAGNGTLRFPGQPSRADEKSARGRCPTCGRQARVHKVVGKLHRTQFPTAPTRLELYDFFGNPINGATKCRSVTVTYGLTGWSLARA